MSSVIPGRRTALLDDEVVVFLIGMRINRFRSLRSWLAPFRAMPKMLAELARDPDLGLLHAQWFWSGRVIGYVQYWRSFEHLADYARDRDREHLPAWREFNRVVRDNGLVGIFHETYRVRSGSAETVYGNMPAYGLAAAVGGGPVATLGQSAARRMRSTEEDVPAVAPY
jgi:hypothetical protein